MFNASDIVFTKRKITKAIRPKQLSYVFGYVIVLAKPYYVGGVGIEPTVRSVTLDFAR